MMNIKSFEAQILFFNGMYGLAVAPYPGLATQAQDLVDQKKIPEGALYTEGASYRLAQFKNILLEEIKEVDDILMKLADPATDELDILTDMADWLGDIQVYCASEMVRFGIPIKETTDIIMESNFSKLGANGEPIYDERGKVLKGPNYWKPELQIRNMLFAKIADHNPVQSEDKEE